MERKERGTPIRFSRFEEMPVWKDARILTKDVYELTRKGTFAKDFGLSNQIQRSVVSVIANIAEGYERASEKEFLRFLATAKGSVGEIRCHLYVATDLGYISDKEFAVVHKQCVSISTQISNFSTYLRKKTLHADG